MKDPTDFKQALGQYGVNRQVSSVLLDSQIQIIEVCTRFLCQSYRLFFVEYCIFILLYFCLQIYKMLDVSSKFKEKYLCNPLEAYSFLKASPYFYNSSSLSPRITKSINENFRTLINEKFTLSDARLTDEEKLEVLYNQLTDQEKANYNLANIICRIPKKSLITDADFLSKEMQFNSFTNYVNFADGVFCMLNFVCY